MAGAVYVYFKDVYNLSTDQMSEIGGGVIMMPDDPDGMKNMIEDYFGVNCEYEDVVDLMNHFHKVHNSGRRVA